ncbi:MAG: S-layer homology domain-containing protein [Monoglobaceae bacterium]
MKKFLSLFLSLMCISASTLSALANSGDTILLYDISCDNKHTITVPTGTVIDVSYVLENTSSDDKYIITTIQNEIYWDNKFFELVDGSIEPIYASKAGDHISSEKEHRIYFNTGATKEYSQKQLIGKFRLKVTETQNGAQSTVKSLLNMAFGSDFKEFGSKTENLTVIVGNGDSPINNYTVTYKSDGSILETVQAAEGEEITLKNPPSKSGYTFEGWRLNDEIYNSGDKYKVNSDITFDAVWYKNSGGSNNSKTRYTLSFETNGGSKIDSITRPKNTSIDLDNFTSSRSGYTFDGWYKDKELTDKTTSVTLKENTTVYAKWTKDNGSGHGGARPDILTEVHDAYIVGREDGLIHPNDNITRAEVAEIFYRLLKEEVRSANYSSINDFDDVDENSWYNSAVSTLNSLEIVKGRSEDIYAPDEFITRAEFAAVAARFSNAEYNGEDKFSDIDGHWAQDYINRAAELGWIVGENGIFRPDDYITRAETVTLVNRVLCREPENTEDLLYEMKTWGDNSDTDAWYYTAIQEATNSHNYTMKKDGIHEKWISLREGNIMTEAETE